MPHSDIGQLVVYGFLLLKKNFLFVLLAHGLLPWMILNSKMMKKNYFIRPLFLLFTLLSISWSSCIIIEDDSSYYGPNGLDGKAWFGIDFDQDVPYSYWDDNPNMPTDPFYGEYYRTTPGLYHFEYFVTPYEYWYGTYEIYINYGQPGGPHGQPGADGDDSYLLLVCNPDGFYFENWEECSCRAYQLPDSTWIIEGQSVQPMFRVEMKKASVANRPAQHVPKLTNKPI